MIKKSLTTGAIVGLLLTLAALYPTFTALDLAGVLPFTLLAWRPGAVFQVILLVVLVNLMVVLAAMIGSAAALRTRARTFKRGMYAGLISGTVVGLVVYSLLVAPTAAVVAGRDVLSFELPAGVSSFPPKMITDYLQSLMVMLDVYVLAIGLIAGGLQGGLVGWLRRNTPPAPRPSLLDAVEDGRGRRAWFAAYDDETTRAGLVAGLGGGVVLLLMRFATLGKSASLLNQPDLSMEAIFQQVTSNVPLGGLLSSQALPALLAPLAFLAWAGVGGLAAFLPKNPASRLRARIYAALVAGTVVGLILSIQDMVWIHWAVGLLPQLMQTVLAAPRLDLGVNIPGLEPFLMVLTVLLSAAPIRALLASVLSTARVRVLLMYILPLPFIGFTTLYWTAWSGLQGAVYGLALMLFRLRPVDRARVVRRELQQHADQLLPRLYRVFQADRNALQVLEHLAFNLKDDPVKARVVAAYHTLCAQPPERAAQALDVVARTLDEQPTWKLHAEVGMLHGLMAQGLRAETVAQIRAIAPMQDQQTSALPPLLAKAGEHLGRILNELRKTERVDDLNTKIIFLNNTLENLHLAQVFLEEGAACGDARCASLPEFHTLCALLEQWESLVLSTVKDIQGRAKLTAELKTRKLTSAPRLALSVVLTNHGLNVAEDVRLQVSDCSGEYAVLEGQAQRIDILPPQDSRELSFTIKPLSPSRQVRVCWTLTYDDALNDDRVLEFGDLVEFIEAEKPFQRIFPIPYVTGTPLQSGEMFVGRKDVFDFVREHLLGVYQNNVIVLHGQRRTGKTSVLYRLGDVLADTHQCVLIDMQGKAARGEVDFLYSIADDIVYALENKGIAVELPPRRDFEQSPEFFFRSRFLRGVYDALGDKNLLLMFDEFEELEKRVEDGKLTPDIFPYLRNLMQHERKVDFVFAGTHKLEELAAEYWSILFNIAAYKKITFLEPEEVTRLVTQPVAPYGLEYDPLAIERIYQVAAGHPYFTQVVCHELVAYHNETQRSYLTTTCVDEALGRIIERGEAHFKYIWAESSTPQRLVLLALAELLEVGEAATPDDVAARLHKRGRPLDGGMLPEALNNLESRDILMRSDPRSSLYRFRVDLIRRWIYATRPAYEKVV